MNKAAKNWRPDCVQSKTQGVGLNFVENRRYFINESNLTETLRCYHSSEKLSESSGGRGSKGRGVLPEQINDKKTWQQL